MNWLSFFAMLWGTIAALVLLFVAVDARNAYDQDPGTRTLSGYIRAWRRRGRGRAAVLGAAVISLTAAPIYLFGHLVLDLY